MVLSPVCQARRYMWLIAFMSGAARKRFSDCDWSIHFWRRAAASISHSGSIWNAVR